MQIWNYHPDTGQLISESTALPSPEEPGQFLIPANATTIAPPAPQPGYTYIFSNGAWSSVHGGDALDLSSTLDMGSKTSDIMGT
jgi:hypothetical protein